MLALSLARSLSRTHILVGRAHAHLVMLVGRGFAILP